MKPRTIALGALILGALSIMTARSLTIPRGGPLHLTINAQPAQRGVARLGVNLGTWTSWGAEQLSSNVLMNPGFETTIDRATVIVSHRGAHGFEDDQAWLARPDNFWRGARYDVRSGAAAGRRGVLTGSSSAGPDGMPLYETDTMPRDLAAGDVIALTQDHEPGLPANWWIAPAAAARISIDTTQHRPGSPGRSALSLKFGGPAPAAVSSYLDAITARAGKLLPINGPWRLSFWSRADGLTNAALRVTFGRIGATAFLDRTIKPAAAWEVTTLDFAGHDDQVPAATLELRFSASGNAPGRILLDDVDLRARNSAAAPFRSAVVAALTALHPGYLRDWQGQLGDTLANRIAAAFGRHPSRYRPGAETAFGYSLPDFLGLCREIGARPWIIVPPTFSDAELVGLGKFLAAVDPGFDQIALELGNENWNAIFRPAGIPDAQTYGAVANRAFGLIREGAGSALRLRMAVGGQYANPDWCARAAGSAPAADTVAVAPYFMYSLAAGLAPAQRLAALFGDPGDNLFTVHNDAVRAGKTLAIYEVNLHTVGGDAPDAERNPLAAGAAAGAALAWRIIQSLNAGAAIECPYVLAGFDTATAVRGGLVRLWGVTRDLAGAPRLRPTGLAMALLNQVIGGDFYPVSGPGATVSGAAFLYKSQWSAALVSAADRPVTVLIEFPALPAAALPARRLQMAAASPFSTNEEEAQVRVVEAPAVRIGREVTVTLPPYGLAALVGIDSGGQQP